MEEASPQNEIKEHDASNLGIKMEHVRKSDRSVGGGGVHKTKNQAMGKQKGKTAPCWGREAPDSESYLVINGARPARQTHRKKKPGREKHGAKRRKK